jgi:AAA ATPase domain
VLFCVSPSKACSRDADQLKETVIGIDVFERGAAYSPQEDPVVRVMAGRLRGRLAEYYQASGGADPILIDLPRGGYVPRFTLRRLPAAVPEVTFRSTHPPGRTSVGRRDELNRLRAAFDFASAGAGSMVAVSGEAGMGKTTVVEDFLAGVEGIAWVGCGRSSERLAETDAFVPVFDSLDRLLRGDAGAVVADIMKTSAPTWYVQVAQPSR